MEKEKSTEKMDIPAIYSFLDYFQGIRRSCECRVIEKHNKTYKIKLTTCGPNGSVPGSVLNKVKPKNIKFI
jgi:hypothetical protein